MKNTCRFLIALLVITAVSFPVFAGGKSETEAAETTVMGHEAPMLAEKVAAGTLEPLEDRLPENPLVVVPTEEIGQYGGTWRTVWKGLSDPWGPHQTGNEPLLRYSQDAGSLIANVAERFEASSDSKVFTIYLRKGLKWSDGVEFTAEDILFLYNDVFLNKELSPAYPKKLTSAGKPPIVEGLDDYTVRFTFEDPYGLFFSQLTVEHYSYVPKHYMKQFHPAYTPMDKLEKMAKEAGFDKWYELYNIKGATDGPVRGYWWITNTDHPTLWPWKLTQSDSDTATGRLIWERNEYYWKVDTDGNQLPYIDKVTFDLVGTDEELLNLKAIAGEIDLISRGLSVGKYPLYMENRDKGDYRVLAWQDPFGSRPELMLNQTVEDPNLRKLFTDVRFRQALSLGINRNEINELIYNGLGEPRQASLVKASRHYNEEWTQLYAEFDPDKANSMLDEIGLNKKNADGIRLHPDGTPVSFVVENIDVAWYVDTVGLVVDYWKNLGLQVTQKTSARSLYTERRNANEIQVQSWTQPGGSLLFNVWTFFPYHTQGWAPKNAIYYKTGGSEGEKPVGDIARLLEIYELYQMTADPAAQDVLLNEAVAIHMKNLYMIGTVGAMPQFVIAKNNFRNVPDDIPADFASLGTPRVGMPEQFFFKK